MFYLAPEAVVALLRATADASAAGSVLVLDVMSKAGLGRPAMDAYRRYAAANGQPPPFGHDDPTALLSGAGWRIDRLTWAGAPDANYGRFTRPAGNESARPSPRERAHLVVGRR